MKQKDIISLLKKTYKVSSKDIKAHLDPEFAHVRLSVEERLILHQQESKLVTVVTQYANGVHTTSFIVEAVSAHLTGGHFKNAETGNLHTGFDKQSIINFCQTGIFSIDRSNWNFNPSNNTMKLLLKK